MNPTLENLQLDRESLLAQSRFLNDEIRWADQQLRAQETLLAHVLHPKFPRRVYLGSGQPTPKESDDWHVREVLPVEKAIADLQARKSLLAERQVALQADLTALTTLIDRCTRHVGATNPERDVAVAAVTTGRDLSPYL